MAHLQRHLACTHKCNRGGSELAARVAHLTPPAACPGRTGISRSRSGTAAPTTLRPLFNRRCCSHTDYPLQLNQLFHPPGPYTSTPHTANTWGSAPLSCAVTKRAGPPAQVKTTTPGTAPRTSQGLLIRTLQPGAPKAAAGLVGGIDAQGGSAHRSMRAQAHESGRATALECGSGAGQHGSIATVRAVMPMPAIAHPCAVFSSRAPEKNSFRPAVVASGLAGHVRTDRVWRRVHSGSSAGLRGVWVQAPGSHRILPPRLRQARFRALPLSAWSCAL